MTCDRRQSLVYTNGDPANSKTASTALLTTGSEFNDSTTSRRGSKTSRSSLSLSRLAGKLSKDKNVKRSASNGPQSENFSRPPTSDGSKTLDIGKPQTNPFSNGHLNGVLGKRSIEKGERECLLM